MKVVVGYPTRAEELEIVQPHGRRSAAGRARCSTPHELVELLQDAADRVFVAPRGRRLRGPPRARDARPAAHGLTDLEPLLAYGASPRASLGLVAAARALALLRGREYVAPRGRLDVAPDVLRHRLVLSFEALADGVDAEDVISARPRLGRTAERRAAADPGPVVVHAE